MASIWLQLAAYARPTAARSDRAMTARVEVANLVKHYPIRSGIVSVVIAMNH